MSAGFEIVRANEADIPGIMRVMESAAASIGKREWFLTDDEEYVRKHIADEGLILIAKDHETVAAFFIGRYPAMNDDNMGRDIGIEGDELLKCAHMESAAVLPEYRGNGLQKKLVSIGVEMMREAGFKHLFSTVHPDNIASMKSMTANGFAVKKTKLKYGSMLRNIMYREI